jgi:hypothetical protein
LIREIKQASLSVVLFAKVLFCKSCQWLGELELGWWWWVADNQWCVIGYDRCISPSLFARPLQWSFYSPCQP